MKKLYQLLIAFMCVCMVACGNDDGVDNSRPKPEVPEPDKITLSQQTIEVGFEPDTYSVNVTSPYSWKAESDNDWIIVESPTGIAGTEQLSFSIARNEEEIVRKGTILLTNSTYNLAAEFYISQAAFVPSELSVTPTTLNFSIDGGEESVAVTANFEHKASTDADWLTITKTEDGYTITALEYLEVDSRTAEVVISNEKYGISEVVNVTQAAFVPSELSVTPTTLNFSAVGGEESVAVTANFEHKASTDADWLSITKTEDGYIIKAYPNKETEERATEVVISNEKYNASEIIQITQEGPNDRQLIYYTSKDEMIVEPYSGEDSQDNFTVFGANIISNTYKNGIGVIVFDGEVTSIGDYAFYDCDSLTSVAIGDSVTTIGDRAFISCSSLTSITIPDSVTTIVDCAFNGCSSLTNVHISDLSAWCRISFEGSDANPLYYAKNLYLNNELVTELVIPSDITEIKSYAFYYCSSLTSITIPDGVTTIGNAAFSGCSSLTSITIPDGITTIGGWAFYNCSSLTSVTIGDSVTTIGKDAFYGCTGELIVNCNIPSALSSSYGAFYGSKFTSVTIGDSVTTIGNYAFYYCDNLTSVTISDSVTTIGEDAFCHCDSLTSVTIGDSVTTIGKDAFYGCTGELIVNCNIPSASSYSYGAFYNSKFTKVTIGDSVTSIGSYAFYGCTGELIVNCNIPSASDYRYGAFYDSEFTSVTIGDSVTTIGDYAFDSCSSLTSVTIGDSVTTIGSCAFCDCDSLTSVTMPDSVTTIGDGAFYNCESLKSVYCKAVTPPAGGYGMFDDNASGRKIYVPTESVEAYKSASYWSSYKSSIVGYNF